MPQILTGFLKLEWKVSGKLGMIGVFCSGQVSYLIEYHFSCSKKPVRCLHFKMLHIIQYISVPQGKPMALILASQRRCKTAAMLMKVSMKRL